MLILIAALLFIIILLLIGIYGCLRCGIHGKLENIEEALGISGESKPIILTADMILKRKKRGTVKHKHHGVVVH